MQLKVKLDIRNPLVGGFPIPRKAFTALWIQFRYEKLADFCYSCGMIGHPQKFCGREARSKVVTGVSPLMQADPSTMRRAVIARDIPSRSQSLITPYCKTLSFRQESVQPLSSSDVMLEETGSGLPTGVSSAVGCTLEGLHNSRNSGDPPLLVAHRQVDVEGPWGFGLYPPGFSTPLSKKVDVGSLSSVLAYAPSLALSNLSACGPLIPLQTQTPAPALLIDGKLPSPNEKHAGIDAATPTTLAVEMAFSSSPSALVDSNRKKTLPSKTAPTLDVSFPSLGRGCSSGP